MPVVQRKQGLDVATQALPGARLTAARTAIAEGAEVERANQERAGVITQLGEETYRIGLKTYSEQQEEKRREEEKARRQADELAFLAAKNETNDYTKDVVYGPQGALAKKGAESFSIPEEVDKLFEQKTSEIAQRLATPEQKLLYERWRTSERDQIQVATRRHVNSEFQTYAAGQLTATVANGVDDATRANTTPNLEGELDVHRGFQVMEAVIGDLKRVGPQIGMSPQQIDQQERSIRTKVHEDTIKVLADQKPAAARDYFAETRDQIAPDRIDDIEKTIRAGSVKKESQDAADKIISEGGTLTQQLEKAKQIDDADVREATESRIEHNNAVQEKAKQQAIEAQDVEIANILDRTRNLSAIPANILSKLSSTARQHYRSYIKDTIEHGEPKTNFNTIYRLKEMARSDPQGFAKLNLAAPEIISNLSRADREQMVDLQMATRNGDTKRVQQGLSGFLTNRQVVDQVFLGAGLDTSPTPGSKDATAYTTLLQAAEEQVALWKVQNPNKEPSNADVKMIADGLLKETVTAKGTGNLRDVFNPFRSYGDTMKRIGDVTLADMPAALRAQAEQWQRNNGRQVNEAFTLSMYRKYLLDEAAKAPTK